MTHSTRIVRDRNGLIAAVTAIEASGVALNGHEQRFLNGLRAESNRPQDVILSGDRIDWLHLLARRHRVEWEEGDKLSAPKAAKRPRRATR